MVACRNLACHFIHDLLYKTWVQRSTNTYAQIYCALRILRSHDGGAMHYINETQQHPCKASESCVPGGLCFPCLAF